MMRIGALAAAAALLLTVSPSSGEPRHGETVAAGVGVATCEQLPRIFASEQLRQEAYQWFLGFASGQNVHGMASGKKSFQDLYMAEPNWILAQVRLSCAKNPAGGVLGGMIQAYENSATGVAKD